MDRRAQGYVHHGSNFLQILERRSWSGRWRRPQEKSGEPGRRKTDSEHLKRFNMIVPQCGKTTMTVRILKDSNLRCSLSFFSKLFPRAGDLCFPVSKISWKSPVNVIRVFIWLRNYSSRESSTLDGFLRDTRPSQDFISTWWRLGGWLWSMMINLKIEHIFLLLNVHGTSAFGFWNKYVPGYFTHKSWISLSRIGSFSLELGNPFPLPLLQRWCMIQNKYNDTPVGRSVPNFQLDKTARRSFFRRPFFFFLPRTPFHRIRARESNAWNWLPLSCFPGLTRDITSQPNLTRFT